MANANVEEELIAYDGLLAVAEVGAAAPTAADSALGVDWTDLGLTVEGVTRSEPVETTTRRGWPKNTKLRTIVSSQAVRWSTALVQTNLDTVELFHGAEVDVDGAIVTNPGIWPQKAFVLDAIDDGDDGLGQIIREYMPKGRIVEVGEQAINTSAGLAWPVVIESEYDPGIGGHTKRYFSALEGS